jgi:hypothetical protein
VWFSSEAVLKRTEVWSWKEEVLEDVVEESEESEENEESEESVEMQS